MRRELVFKVPLHKRQPLPPTAKTSRETREYQAIIVLKIFVSLRVTMKRIQRRAGPATTKRE
jgi:hypothetical protein